ncbi:MAG: hypothetical protein ABI992_03250 [Chthoniobacterales bacterium]
MMARRKPLVVLLGLMTTMPVGGVIWQTLHYLIGLQRLGFDVHYAEDHGVFPAMLADTFAAEDPDGARRAADFLQRTLEEFNLGDAWSYHSWQGSERSFGRTRPEYVHLLSEAALVINLHGGTLPREEYPSDRLIYLETDPVAPEIELHDRVRATEEFLDAHVAHFSFGENLGAPDCGVPVPPPRYRFHATRQPVVLELWQAAEPAKESVFTTIANWKQEERRVKFKGEIYHWSKHREFMKFLDLPCRSEQVFELALSSLATEDRRMLEAHGWRVREALDFSRKAEAYRDYIMSSRGEWTVAKDQNVRLRSGWFSDRSATYLAAGRPVVMQDTGFSNILPTDAGLFAFSSMEETLDALARIQSDYAAHSNAAREIAREFFSHDVVLPKLLRTAGISLPGTSA